MKGVSVSFAGTGLSWMLKGVGVLCEFGSGCVVDVGQCFNTKKEAAAINLTDVTGREGKGDSMVHEEKVIDAV